MVFLGLMDWVTEEPPKPRNPRVRRLEAALGYSVMVIRSLVFVWAIGQPDISRAVGAVGVMLYVGGGCMAWRGSRRQEYQPPIELGLAQEPPGDDPAK